LSDDADPAIERLLTTGVSDFGERSSVWVRRMLSTAPPVAEIGVAENGTGTGTTVHRLSLGDTFSVEGHPWRFVDIRFTNPHRFEVTVHRVQPGSPPFEPPPLAGSRVWNEVELHPFGTAGEEQLARLEDDLGRRLPREYREWIAEHNGAGFAGDVHVPDAVPFVLGRFHPLYGIFPDRPRRDLRRAEAVRRKWLTDSYIVIAQPIGGILAVNVRPGRMDAVFLLSDDDRHRADEGLTWIAPDIYSFCAYLQPMPPAQPARPV
jgi:hypothetical protein